MHFGTYNDIRCLTKQLEHTSSVAINISHLHRERGRFNYSTPRIMEQSTKEYHCAFA